jgi:hypothetical protein
MATTPPEGTNSATEEALAQQQEDAALLVAMQQEDPLCVPCDDSSDDSDVSGGGGQTKRRRSSGTKKKKKKKKTQKKKCCPKLAELTLHLHRPWFDAIALGYKIYEYRELTPYWTTRVEGRKYDTIRFINGYGRDYPTMVLKYKGYDLHTHDGKQYYRLKLGPVLHVYNYRIPTTVPRKAACVDVNQCFHPKAHRECLHYCKEEAVWVPNAYEPMLQVEPHIQREPSRRCKMPPACVCRKDGNAD